MAKDWMKTLLKLDGAVTKRDDPFKNVISSPSPSVNFTFGRGWGLPIPYTGILYGAPGSGKSVLANGMIGAMHRDFPDGYAIKFNTEFRETVQTTTEQMKTLYGIDPDRYIAYEVNDPAMIFDRIENDVRAQVQDGMPLKLVVIDSITGILGRRALGADSIMKQQIGDRAQTLGDGFKRILKIQRECGFSVLLTDHVRAELDQLEVMRGNTIKMAASFAVQHYAEFFMFVEQLKTKDGRKDALGNEFVDESQTDLAGRGERTGYKTRVTMKKSSLGVAGRTGIFTFSYDKGFINQHEEIFSLAVDHSHVIEHSGNTYQFGDKKWVGRQATLKALADDPHLCAEVLAAVRGHEFQDEKERV
jgi:RecA/RadA recombinase